MWYTAKEDAGTPEAQGMYGLIAEEVATVDPTLVYWVPDEANLGARRPEAVHYQQLGPLAIKALQGRGTGSRSWRAGRRRPRRGRPSWRAERLRSRPGCGSYVPRWRRWPPRLVRDDDDDDDDDEEWIIWL